MTKNTDSGFSFFGVKEKKQIFFTEASQKLFDFLALANIFIINHTECVTDLD